MGDASTSIIVLLLKLYAAMSPYQLATQLSLLARDDRHYRKTLLCRVPAAHGETVKTHGKYHMVTQATANPLCHEQTLNRTAKCSHVLAADSR
jgi:hypothetical protein